MLEDDEIALESADSSASGGTGWLVTLRPCALPPAEAPLPRADGFGADEWAARLPDGRVVAFLREPVARCHLDRIRVEGGGRRFERPLPPWVYYGAATFFAPSPDGSRLLVGGPRGAWIVDADGAVTTLLDEADGEGVHVAWRDADTAVAAGWQKVAIDRRGARTTLPCNRAVGVCVVAGLVVVSDDDGSQWIADGRPVARDWRPYARAAGDVIVSTAGDAYRVSVRAG